MWFDSPFSFFALLGLIPWFYWTSRATRPREWLVGSIEPFLHLAAKHGNARRRWPLSAWLGALGWVAIATSLAGPRAASGPPLQIQGNQAEGVMRQAFDEGAGRFVQIVSTQPQPISLPPRVEWQIIPGWANDFADRAAILSVRPASAGRWAIHWAKVGSSPDPFFISLLDHDVRVASSEKQGIVYLPHPDKDDIRSSDLLFEIKRSNGKPWQSAWSTYSLPLPLFLLPHADKNYEWRDALEAALPGSRANIFGGLTMHGTPILTIRTDLQRVKAPAGLAIAQPTPQAPEGFLTADLIFDGDPFEQCAPMDAAAQVAKEVRAWMATTPDGNRDPSDWWPVTEPAVWPENIWPDPDAWPTQANAFLLAGFLLFGAAFVLMHRGR
ncbi:MAG: hypothetical protein HN405_09310 [Planctomycetes bacterium]|jgi:hypothetical protein|nr:hypothetical protein [Planctomycetota bacterium]MBT4028568.1 hypothetical protein [Planctomycetota bacterium]MBT4559460.1 hypothetical protein [Planctomycetota bacterium]MBT5101280.1 hypothetical protein [Planctomycetota bacterium]MBT7012610.1 hypothetical protein [Planctomycetota bacterium]